MLDRRVLGGRCPPLMLPGGSFRLCLLGGGGASPVGAANPAGPVVAGGPVGTLKVLEPLEHLVLDHADPAGQHADIQEVLEP